MFFLHHPVDGHGDGSGGVAQFKQEVIKEELSRISSGRPSTGCSDA